MVLGLGKWRNNKDGQSAYHMNSKSNMPVTVTSHHLVQCLPFLYRNVQCGMGFFLFPNSWGRCLHQYRLQAFTKVTLHFEVNLWAKTHVFTVFSLHITGNGADY